ncbi:sulphydryl oxidase [Thelonectria olida]|uniref:Sulphydryl oxidase n=1 Tax=Thelonectria olida TaxID=1576542 RepID=A0A9P9AJE0_9HYPO|nr:sulphydryl oxidase [Thelonectria olida]
MRFFNALLPALFTLANAAAIEKEDSKYELYDAIIVGGGPAGLAALSGLARVRRNVLLIDSGEYRNAPTRHMHDVLGFDGVTPAYFRWAARKQLSYYDTVSMTNGTVTKVVPRMNNTRFEVTKLHNGKEKILTARKVVLATGLRDILPKTPGIEENWGKGIFWCPWCDGHEHADQPLGLLAPLDEVPGMVREMLTLNKDIIAFVNGTDTETIRVLAENKTVDYETYLDIHNVKVDNRTIKEIKRLKDGSDDEDANPSLPSVAEFDEFSVEFAKGLAVKRAAFFASFPSEQRSTVGEDLGVYLYKGRLAADQAAGLSTNIAGVYAIGDANSDNVTNVPHALFSGKRTAVYLHVRLERENAAEEIAAAKDGNDEAKREFDLDETAHLPRDEEVRSLWERMNEDPRDVLYAGEFDQ